MMSGEKNIWRDKTANSEIIRTPEKKSDKYLRLLKADTIKQANMKEKNR